MAKTKYLTKNEPKKAYIPCIFIRKLKWVAPGSGWWENSEIFLVTPEVYTQSWLTLRKDSQHFIIFRTPYCSCSSLAGYEYNLVESLNTELLSFERNQPLRSDFYIIYNAASSSSLEAKLQTKTKKNPTILRVSSLYL